MIAGVGDQEHRVCALSLWKNATRLSWSVSKLQSQCLLRQRPPQPIPRSSSLAGRFEAGSGTRLRYGGCRALDATSTRSLGTGSWRWPVRRKQSGLQEGERRPSCGGPRPARWTEAGAPSSRQNRAGRAPDGGGHHHTAASQSPWTGTLSRQQVRPDGVENRLEQH